MTTDALVEKTIPTPYGPKRVSVHSQDILSWERPLDVMTVSAFKGDYYPMQGTLLGALDERGIEVEVLARDPEIDLRDVAGVWLSHDIDDALLPVGRVGCMELVSSARSDGSEERGQQIISRIQAYFHMLHIASLSGIEMGTVGLSVPGGGNQEVDAGLTAIPTLNECLRFLKSNESVREICVISNNQAQAYQFARALDESYASQRELAFRPLAGGGEGPLAFISYSSKDRDVADELCKKLEARGIGVWYAPRNISATDYASAIVDAITRCTHFVVIVSANSLQSNHVLNEIDLAFQELGRQVRLMPLRLDEEEMGAPFRYYLSRLHWEDACVPPLEQRLEEFADVVVQSQ